MELKELIKKFNLVPIKEKDNFIGKVHLSLEGEFTICHIDLKYPVPIDIEKDNIICHRCFMNARRKFHVSKMEQKIRKELYWYHAKVLKVIKPDILELDIDLGLDQHVTKRLPIFGFKINPNQTKKIENRYNKLKKLVTGKQILIHTEKNIHGRLFASIHLDDKNINEILMV